jgi:hypothetical protein
MDLEEVIKAAVPLTFLAIWALTSLFNREAKPMPGRPMQGLGPRPGGPAAGPAAGPRPANAMARDPAVRWGNPAGTPATGAGTNRPLGRTDDEVLVIRSEPTRAAQPPLPRPGAAPPKRTVRAKSAPAAPPKRPEPSPSRPLAGTTGPALSQHLARPLDSTSLSGTAAANAASDAAAAVYDAKPKSATTLALYDLRSLAGSRDELRKAIIINEILQPPVSRRHGRRVL